MELGRYRILSQLGQGGMATVYLAEDPLLNRLVAIKVIQAHLTSNNSLIDRFTVEAKTIAALRHVNIVEVFDFGFQDNQQFLVMEYIDGQNLQALCSSLAGKPMSNTVAAAIICMASEGLTSAEKHGVVHRDIKPENLLFNSEGVLKIADFGIAHISDEQSRTQTGAVLGSPNFMSPEQIEGVKPTNKTDLFSLGGVFYYCLTGKLPFTGPSIPVTMRNICDKPHPSILELNPDADPILVSLIDKVLHKDPAQRGEGARWLANQLRAWLTRRDVVDIVEHARAFIIGSGVQSNQTLVESPGSGSKVSRPGTKIGQTALNRSGSQNLGSGAGSLATTRKLPGQSTYSPQPTTGTMGPSSRSPLVWIGALLSITVLLLAGVILWTARSNKEKPVLAPMAMVKPKVEPRVVVPPPRIEPEIDPLASEAQLRPIPKTPEVARVASNDLQKRPTQITTSHPPQTVRPSPKAFIPPKDPEVNLVKTGFVMIKSAPPFAALTINGKPQGETPMNSWLEVPLGRCHIEIVHRLTPPFDTVITILAGNRLELKFKLDR